LSRNAQLLEICCDRTCPAVRQRHVILTCTGDIGVTFNQYVCVFIFLKRFSQLAQVRPGRLRQLCRVRRKLNAFTECYLNPFPYAFYFCTFEVLPEFGSLTIHITSYSVTRSAPDGSSQDSSHRCIPGCLTNRSTCRGPGSSADIRSLLRLAHILTTCCDETYRNRQNDEQS